MTELAAETFRLLDELSSRAAGVTARELSDQCGLAGTPSTRLNVLARHGFASVNSHNQKWWITTEGFNHWADRSEVEDVERASAAWLEFRAGCGCDQCSAWLDTAFGAGGIYEGQMRP